MIEMYGYYREGYEFFPGRKVVLLKIKNKSRFVTVSFLLASLVTVISSASAVTEPEPGGERTLTFDFTVEDCSDADEPATWNPSIESAPSTVQSGSAEEVFSVLTGLQNGVSGCDDGSMNVNGAINASFAIEPNFGDWWETIDCAPYCAASDNGVIKESISGSYRVPLTSGSHTGTIILTWTPE
jgi:hypothetical protein